MDKESVILKYQQTEVDALGDDISALEQSSISQEDRLHKMQDQMSALYAQSGKVPVIPAKKKRLLDRLPPKNDLPKAESSFDALFALAQDSLRQRGLSVDDLDYNDLVSEDELADIEQELNAPIPKKYKWTKSDYIAVFIAALVGCAADAVLSDRNNRFTGKNSKFSKKLNELHEKTFKHKSGAPIDYQGAGFGGGYHRELSKGHDLARFVEGIKSFKNGTFEALRYENGVAKKVIMSANQYSTPYAQLSVIEAIIEYSHHMFADLFSTNSLPFPGYSFFAESSSRNCRKLAAEMYQNGFNLKNVITQSLSAIIIEVIIRIYFGIQSVSERKAQYEIAEDYSNWEIIKSFSRPQAQDKLNEALLVAHAIVAAENIGKIAIKCLAGGATGLGAALAEINIAEIIAVVRYGVSVVSATYKRNSEYAKLIYSADTLGAGWETIVAAAEADSIDAMSPPPQLI